MIKFIEERLNAENKLNEEELEEKYLDEKYKDRKEIKEKMRIKTN